MNILRNVPPESRFYIERVSDSTIVTPGISPSFAGGKLAGENSNEMDIFVEDGCAKSIVQSFIGCDIRTRVNIIPIGSDVSVVRQLSARYKNQKKGECLAILDGDKSGSLAMEMEQFIKNLQHVPDNISAKEWVEKRLVALPGDERPELWLLDQCNENVVKQLSDYFSLSPEKLAEAIERAKLAGKHREFYALSQELGHSGSEELICQTLCQHIAMQYPKLFKDTQSRIIELLD